VSLDASAAPSLAPIATARLVLRPLDDSDLPRLVALAGDRDVARMVAVIPHPYSEADGRALIARVRDGGEDRVWAIAHDGGLIGCAGFDHQDDGSADLGYWIGKPYWGHGYATEAAQAVVAQARTQGWYRAIRAIVFDDNPASLRVMEKLGFARAGTDLRGCLARVGTHPCQVFACDDGGGAPS
jgi:ribosomal-protein-alanine N-acetyltransferase